jgi:hypothetical protein
MSDSTFEPNTFQTPNEYVDRYLPYLTGEEVKVLLYATRRILGFQKRQDRISISLFTDGMRSRNDEVLDMGTGLSNETVIKCLANLVEFGLLVRLQENDNKKNEGVLWSLQWKKANVNEKALMERATKKAESQKSKMEKARSMRQTPPNDIERGSGNGIEDPSPCGIETQNPEETQGNPDLLINGDQPETPITENTDEEAERMKYDLLIFQVSPNHRGYFDEFYRLTKLLPEGKKQLKEWIDACSALWSAKVEVKDMEQAFRAQLEANFSIKNPGSLLATMQTIKMRRENGIQIKPKQNIARKVKDDLTAAFEQYGKEQGFI